MQDQSSPSPLEEENSENHDDDTPMFLTRRQNSVPGGRSLGQTGHEATIMQGSPFIYCGAPTVTTNSHRRLVHHNSMRTPSNLERNNNGGSGISNNNHLSSGSRRLKRHDTDPSMGKNHSGLLLCFCTLA